MKSRQPSNTPTRRFTDPTPLPPIRISTSAPSGLLSRAWRWLEAQRQDARTPRRLQLCATVALGEKRFVSIVECDGQQFLIGGGAGNVSLLAQLPAVKEPTPIRPERAR